MKTNRFKKEHPKVTRWNYYGSWRSAAFVSILVCYLLISAISFADEGSLNTTLTKAEIGQLVEAPRSEQRKEAAESILNAVDFDTTWAFETMIKGIRVEQDYQLVHSKEGNQGSFWTSWRNIQRYVRDLALLGMHSPDALRDFGENLSPDQKRWVLIAQGYQGKEILHDRLRQIIAEKGNPLQKAMAVEAISEYKDTSDISILVDAALDQENSIEWAPESDISGFNPVAEAGSRALWEMGYVLEWDPQEFVFKLKRREEAGNKYPPPE